MVSWYQLFVFATKTSSLGRLHQIHQSKKEPVMKTRGSGSRRLHFLSIGKAQSWSAACANLFSTQINLLSKRQNHLDYTYEHSTHGTAGTCTPWNIQQAMTAISSYIQSPSTLGNNSSGGWGKASSHERRRADKTKAQVEPGAWRRNQGPSVQGTGQNTNVRDPWPQDYYKYCF